MEAGVGQGPGDNPVLSVETSGLQTITHWEPTPDLAHTDTGPGQACPLWSSETPKQLRRFWGIFLPFLFFFFFFFLPNSFLFVHRKFFAAFLMAGSESTVWRSGQWERGTVNELAGSAG